MAELRFYLDENIPIVIAEQLRRREIVAVTVRDLRQLGDADENHLRRATAMGYVLCSYDTDYVQLATTGIDHCGIIIAQLEQHWVGAWVAGLALYHTVYSAADMLNRLDYL